MSKLLTAMLAAGIGFGLNTFTINQAHSAPARNFSDFKVMVKRCDALTGSERKQCMADARDTYRDSHFNCDAMSAEDKTQCLRYGQWWKSAATEENSAVTHTENPTTMPATADDPAPAERNRDSTKQNEDANHSLEPKK
jgi:hypothetical protein